MMNKLKKWILPKEIDFFKSLSDQSLLTQTIIEELQAFYTDKSKQEALHIFDLITESKKNHSAYLKDLNATFITPVDRESISRVYSNLYWVVLSIKHLIIEVDTYKIYYLGEYSDILGLLKQEMSQLTQGFNDLGERNFDAALKVINQIIHLDNELIYSYAAHLAKLFEESDTKHVLMHKEILSQLKEISKRIHTCANLLEDIVFKIT